MAEAYLLRLRGYPFKTLLISGKASEIAFAVVPNAVPLSERAARERLADWRRSVAHEPHEWAIESLVAGVPVA